MLFVVGDKHNRSSSFSQLLDLVIHFLLLVFLTVLNSYV